MFSGPARGMAHTLVAMMVGGTTASLSAAMTPVGLASLTPPACTLPLSISVGAVCTIAWPAIQPVLRPTQQAVGFAWTLRKLKDMDSAKHAQSAMDKSPLPVALGAGGSLYLIDHHHELAALDYTGYRSVKVTVFVVCDFSSLSPAEAWTALVARGLAYPYGRRVGDPDSLPHRLNETALPNTLRFSRNGSTTFVDDPWRSLASFVRKVEVLPDGKDCPKHASPDCMRGYIRTCTASGASIPFFEFRWAYFFCAAHQPSGSYLWDSATSRMRFETAYAAATADPTAHNAWEAAGESLVYLARGLSASTYTLPSAMGAMAGRLPGVVTGLQPIDSDDPNCDTPECTAVGPS